MPRTDHVDFCLGELQTLASAIVGHHFFHFSDNHALADRPAEVRTNVFVGKEFAVELEHPDLDAVRVNHLTARVAEALNCPDIDLTHRLSPGLDVGNCACCAQSVGRTLPLAHDAVPWNHMDTTHRLRRTGR